MNVLCCLSLGVIKPCQVRAEGSFTETYWISQYSYTAYDLFMNGFGFPVSATGNSLNLTQTIDATISEISYTSGNGAISTTTNGTNTISDIVMNIVNDLPTISQNTGNLFSIKYETGSEYPEVNEIGCTFDGYVDYSSQSQNYYYDTLTADCNIQGLSGDVSIYDAAAWREALSWHVDLYTAGTDPITGVETQDAITITAVDTTTGNEFISLTTNSTSSLTGTITTTATGSWNYDMPGLTASDTNFTYQSTNASFRVGTTPIYIAFWLKSNGTAALNDTYVRTFTNNSNVPVSLTITDTTSSRGSAYGSVYKKYMRKYLLKLSADSTVIGGFNFVNSTDTNRFWVDKEIIPLYFGDGEDLSDDYRRYIGLSDKLLDLLESGTTASNNSSGNLDNSSGNFSDASDDLIDLEDSALNDMQSDLASIDSGGIISNLSNFNNAINWVKVQFEEMTVGYPIGIFISVSLLLALAAVIVGRL